MKVSVSHLFFKADLEKYFTRKNKFVWEKNIFFKAVGLQKAVGLIQYTIYLFHQGRI